MKNSQPLCLVALSLMTGAAYAQSPAPKTPTKPTAKIVKTARHHHKTTRKVALHATAAHKAMTMHRAAAPAPAKKS